ncbi:hypothetical protein [Mailhella massiliensis]|uniref:hypothetical protein n=1 Tax=Mailhella massiliensis TaxID=1903261 RepID=UPI001185E71C|nr:hypothetical protein [Mailhella massiliensis]
MSEETTRYNRLRAYLILHDVSMSAIGRRIGLSPQYVRRILSSDEISQKNHTIMRAQVGIPEDLLPKIREEAPRRNYIPRKGYIEENVIAEQV